MVRIVKGLPKPGIGGYDPLRVSFGLQQPLPTQPGGAGWIGGHTWSWYSGAARPPVASIEQPAVIERILKHLGRDADVLDLAHPRRTAAGRARDLSASPPMPRRLGHAPPPRRAMRRWTGPLAHHLAIVAARRGPAGGDKDLLCVLAAIATNLSSEIRAATLQAARDIFGISMTTAQDSHRLVDWNKLVSESLMPMRVMGNHGSHFEGRLWLFDLGGVEIMKVVSSPALVRRTRPDIAAHETNRTFVITLAGQSGFGVRTRGMEGRLRVGDLVILDSSEPSECFHRGCTSISILVDEKTAKAYLPQIDDLAGHIVRGACGAGMLAATAMQATARCVSGESRQKTLGHLAAALLHAIAGAYSEAYDLKVSPSAPGRRRAQIRWFVERHLRDAELTVLGVAAAFGLSDRYLRMLFEHEGESLAAYIQRRRLEEAACQLSDPSCYGRTVSEIAFDCGFNSLGSFDRAFKAHFQSAPGVYRRLHVTRENEYPT